MRCLRCGDVRKGKEKPRRMCPASPPESPPLADRARTFSKAAAKWIAAGRPVRSKERMRELHAICEACPRFHDHACTLCGCPVRRSGVLRNKLAWATESCPDDPPRWEAEITAPKSS